jgi:adenylate cyclase
MRDLLQRDFTVNEMHLEVRIGIGTGPVVAGVVGKKKFIYDLWGDTVNLASRITSEGVPGMVQVDETTYRRLLRFDFHEPQTIYLKGKGNMVVRAQSAIRPERPACAIRNALPLPGFPPASVRSPTPPPDGPRDKGQCPSHSRKPPAR